MEIGKTRAGTVIEFKPNQTIGEFSEEFLCLSDSDKFDVYCMLQFLAVGMIPRKEIVPDEYDWWEARVNRSGELAGDELIEREKLKANASTSYKMVQLGKKMVSHFWRKSQFN